MTPNRPRTALLIEPQLARRFALRRVLDACGFGRVLESEAAEEAITLLGTELVDLVLTPWETDTLSGEALVEALRNRGQNRDVPVVLLDEGLPRQAVVAAVKAGVAGRLPLPPNAETLRAILGTVAAGRGRGDEHEGRGPAG